MKAFTYYSYFIAILVFYQIFFSSCKKGSSNNNESAKPRYYTDDATNREFYFYGSDPNVETGIIKRKSSSDTVLCLQYDEKVRIKMAYIIIKGVPEKTIFEFDYKDTLVVIRQYLSDWQTGDSKFNNLLTVSKKQLAAVIPEVMKDFPMGRIASADSSSRNSRSFLEIQDVPVCNKFGGIVVMTAALGTFGFILCSGNPWCAVVAGLGAAIICTPYTSAAEPPLPYPANPMNRYNTTFADKSGDILGSYTLKAGGITNPNLNFGKNGIIQVYGVPSNYDGYYALHGNSIFFSFNLIAAGGAPGFDYYYGTISNDGKTISGNRYSQDYRYNYGPFLAIRQ
jgi:hypothetical protein